MVRSILIQYCRGKAAAAIGNQSPRWLLAATPDEPASRITRIPDTVDIALLQFHNPSLADGRSPLEGYIVPLG